VARCSRPRLTWVIMVLMEVPHPGHSSEIEPDYIVARDPAAVADECSVVPHDQALLVAEICSPSSIRQDREVKPAKCAQAGIETVPAGRDGGKLTLPGPFGVTTDASTVPEFRPGTLKND
jgi:hypothetical protein